MQEEITSDLDLPFPIVSDTQVLIACGYFDVTTGVDEFSIESMKAGLSLGRELQITHSLSRAPVYTVIANDLGLDCSQDSCTLPGPNEIADIDTAQLVELSDSLESTFVLVRERTMRNRAARLLKRWLKDPSYDESLRLERTEILFDSFMYSSVVAGAINDAGVGIPRCPLIVSEYLDRSFQRLRSSRQSSARVVFDFNRPADRDKVIKGTEMYLARISQGQEAVVQVFFDPITHESISIPYSSHEFGRKVS
ncbi:hypothetical protein [Paenarthrobacter ureafaciens]|uniref:hypothetical protein n=1 Tax=Paenarthrobacter ureafaciens TaxID=37931 RepID=UPI001FB35F92|nr:hypothetical protein [Paenarthrobacter ureafaciens]UOD82316.1 hypothetical protein MQZ73_05465 [Paenarthrobacter ureafaciens]WNZ05814.1 hypothetical protein PVT25_10015 [Paenarthrobacter ureafaciens]